MEPESQIVFGPFHFDHTTQRLWQGPREIHLRARTRAVLHYLLEHPGRVISRQEFGQHVWPKTHVSQSVLRVCIWELRQALGDMVTTPHYIETVGQQGYRFRAPTQSRQAATPQERPFVGRQAELTALHTALAQAQQGRLQLVFVTGDPGLGKTTLVQQCLAQLPATDPWWIGAGQCIEHMGPGEAYLPWLDALGRLGRDAGREPLVEVLRRTAPMWLAHLPLLVEPEEQERLHRQTQGLRPERMLRQLVDALTVITHETGVVLVLEDLQWSDHATVETLAYLARCPEPVRLLVLGTYRPAEVIARGHPLRQTVQELVAHQLGQELRLELLTEVQVQQYVAQCDELVSGWTLLTTGLAHYRHLGCQASLPFFLSFLAETHLRQGQVAEGLAVIAEALRLSNTNFDRFWEAELHRQQGNLLLAQTHPRQSLPGPAVADAEACFQQALAIARQQGAKALELRAATSLSRLWLAQDQPDAAQGLLADIYGWFTEGLQTADLQAAQDLLARCHAAT
jgi:DNA-binding winged helix-turn-helix (wHTH) protein/tetratricopeptide (TPR) repeat protein